MLGIASKTSVPVCSAWEVAAVETLGPTENTRSPSGAQTLPGLLHRPFARSGLVVVVALLWTVFLDLMTPAFDARTYRWESAI